MKSIIALLIAASAASLSAADTPPAGEAVVKPYPLQTCIVADEALGSMGDPVVIVHEGQEVKFCCKGCVKKFTKNPAAFLPKLAPAAAPAAKPADAHHGH